ncbi:MAG: B12-binding domain-containing radical SAM protein [Parcubacteria group bacterium]|nr:B12-binding domain-containing radical SAM protein [Parcubacteria group bacterium]|tara:strand:+ start:65622 stop:67013 length:1392 start_codon:yes stop_codon:yes gene_type:complete
MDILFINPPWYKKSGNIWKSVSACLPPFGLALLAAISREKGFSVSILDFNALQVGLDKFEEHLPDSPPKFIGITATTLLINNALEISKIVRKKYPNTKIIFGGVHTTVMPREILAKKEVDYIVMREGENSLIELLSGKNPEEINGIGFKRDGKLIINEPQPIIPDLNIFPFLAYDILPVNKYYSAAGSYKREPSFGMITSRGCPGRCTFCNGDLFGARIRFKTAEKMVEEIKLLQEKHGIKDIVFYDDTFTSNRNRVKEFCNLILENKMDLTWSCFSRVDTVDLETLKIMKEAGCHQVMYGIESGDAEILKNIQKRISLEKVEETIAATKKAGIDTRLAFMIGNPGETEETIQKTIKYAIFLDPDLAIFNITTPYPGTQMFAWAESNNLLMHKNWEDYNFSMPVMKLPTISSEKVLYYYKKAYQQFYMRPFYILKRLMKIRSFNDLKRNFRPFIGLINFSFNK